LSARARAAALVALLVAAAAPPSAQAWGPSGHRVVGEIAQHHLSRRAARAVRALLGPDSLAEVSTWADDIRNDPAWKHADTWHYATIEDDQTYETSTKNPKGDVVEALGRFTTVLRDPQATLPAKAEALKFVVHFVGDIHQPLHVGRGADAGGNGIQVTWMGQPSNLHSVWDGGMIDNSKLSFTELAAFLEPPPAGDAALWRQQLDPVAWTRESMAFRAQVYQIGEAKLSWQYNFESLPVVRLRLLQAGVRLAALLDSVFAGR
jgi:nuclease S1